MSLRVYRPGALCASETDESRRQSTQTPTLCVDRGEDRGAGICTPAVVGACCGGLGQPVRCPGRYGLPPQLDRSLRRRQRRFPDPCHCVRAPPYSASRCRLTPAPVPRGPTPPSCSATLLRTPDASNNPRTPRPPAPSAEVSPAACPAARPPVLRSRAPVRARLPAVMYAGVSRACHTYPGGRRPTPPRGGSGYRHSHSALVCASCASCGSWRDCFLVSFYGIIQGELLGGDIHGKSLP